MYNLENLEDYGFQTDSEISTESDSEVVRVKLAMNCLKVIIYFILLRMFTVC